MGEHKADGKDSTYAANGGKATPKYQGKHRDGTAMLPHGDRNRVTKEKGGNSDRI